MGSAGIADGIEQHIASSMSLVTVQASKASEPAVARCALV
jgi:hypothetical protein